MTGLCSGAVPSIHPDRNCGLHVFSWGGLYCSFLSSIVVHCMIAYIAAFYCHNCIVLYQLLILVSLTLSVFVIRSNDSALLFKLIVYLSYMQWVTEGRTVHSK